MSSWNKHISVTYLSINWNKLIFSPLYLARQILFSALHISLRSTPIQWGRKKFLKALKSLGLKKILQKCVFPDAVALLLWIIRRLHWWLISLELLFQGPCENCWQSSRDWLSGTMPCNSTHLHCSKLSERHLSTMTLKHRSKVWVPLEVSEKILSIKKHLT